jgi:hypothetical protein
MGVMALAAVAGGCVAEGEAPEAAGLEVSGTEISAPEQSASEGSDDEVSGSAAALSGGAPNGAACAKNDSFEPNDTSGSSVDAPLGKTNGLSLCKGEEDWFRVVVPAGTIVRVGIDTNLAAGDLDLVAYDENGSLVGSRFGETYPYTWRGQETGTEYLGFYSEEGGAVYYVRVVGYAGASNAYSLRVNHFPYIDGQSCTGAGFSFDDCTGKGAKGAGLIPFPFPDPSDSVLGDGYDFASFGNYRFARRELVMLVRNAIAATRRAFPGTKKLSLIDICQMDGTTPGYDIGDPRHPESTHDQGGNIDISYFQTDGANDAEIVCGDGASHADGFCSPAASSQHIVDLPRQAFFMAKLFASSRTRVVGVDQVLAPLLQNAAQALAALPSKDPRRITSSELAGFSGKMSSGAGWPYHHHHIHLSMKWWAQNAAGEGEVQTFSAPWTGMGAPGRSVESLEMAWPPTP